MFELARLPDFASLAVIPEDAVHDHGASFATSEPDCIHVVVDRHLVTGQNEASTLTAVQNLVLLCNQRYEFIIPDKSFKYVQRQSHNDIKLDEQNLDGIKKYMLHSVHNSLSSDLCTKTVSNISSCH